MRWFCAKLPRLSNRKRRDGCRFRKMLKKHRQASSTEAEFLSLIAADIQHWIRSASTAEEPAQIIRHILRYVATLNMSDKRGSQRQLLLILIGILSENNSRNIGIGREILTALFRLSKTIDRELFFWDKDSCGDVGVGNWLSEVDERRRHYVMTVVAGWQLPRIEPWSSVAGSDYYLELPLRKAISDDSTKLITEVMYRFKDAKFVLDLLRHGVSPSCLYLWPICLLLDLKCTWNRPEEALRNSTEAEMIRYFCRARHYIYVQIVLHDTSATPDDHWEMHRPAIQWPPCEINSEDVLLLSPMVCRVLPEDRYRHASTLMHQSRLAIRKALLQADNLPRGISKLLLPKTLQDYVDLLKD